MIIIYDYYYYYYHINTDLCAGTLKHPDGKLETVAIKMLKDNSNSEAKEDFLREVEIMTYFRHQNILTLIGVCPEGKTVHFCFILFKFCISMSIFKNYCHRLLSVNILHSTLEIIVNNN